MCTQLYGYALQNLLLRLQNVVTLRDQRSRERYYRNSSKNTMLEVLARLRLYATQLIFLMVPLHDLGSLSLPDF